MADPSAEVKSGTDLLPLVRNLEDSSPGEVSPAGGAGRYQITPIAAAQYGADYQKLNTSPAYNERVAGTILNDLYSRFHGRIADVLVAYNAGPSAANKWIASGRDLKQLPEETRNYLLKAFGKDD